MDTMDLNYEANRLKTFPDDWPHSFLSVKNLAKTGFYYSLRDPNGFIQCHFCGVNFHNLKDWSHKEGEVVRHYRKVSLCRLLRDWPTENVPLEPISDLHALLSQLNITYSKGELEILERDAKHGFDIPKRGPEVMERPVAKYCRTPVIESSETPATCRCGCHSCTCDCHTSPERKNPKGNE